MFLFLYLFCFCIKNKSCYAINNNWYIDFISPIYVCDDDDSESLFHADVHVIRYTRANSTLRGYIKLLKDVEEGTVIDITIHKILFSRFEIVTYFTVGDLCSVIVDQNSGYNKYYRRFFDFPEKCHWSAGTYNVTEFAFDREQFPMNAKNAGYYIVTVNFNEKNDKESFLGCLLVYTMIEQL